MFFDNFDFCKRKRLKELGETLNMSSFSLPMTDYSLFFIFAYFSLLAIQYVAAVGWMSRFDSLSRRSREVSSCSRWTHVRTASLVFRPRTCCLSDSLDPHSIRASATTRWVPRSILADIRPYYVAIQHSFDRWGDRCRYLQSWAHWKIYLTSFWVPWICW